MNNDATLGTILGVLGIVIGIVTGYIFYVKGKRIKEASWSIDGSNLIKGYSSLFEDLEIKYKGTNIENLTVSRLVFWNNGNEVIDSTDIQTAIPVSIRVFDQVEILDVKVLKESNPANCLTVSLLENKKAALLFFDYLNPNQGALIQVIHTGTNPYQLFIYGQIKGISEIQYKKKRPDRISRIARIAFSFYSLMMFALFAFALYKSIFDPPPDPIFAISPWFLLAVGATFFVIFLNPFLSSRKEANVPKELLIFEKDNIEKR